jgi:hypothetical protein
MQSMSINEFMLLTDAKFKHLVELIEFMPNREDMQKINDKLEALL